MTTIDNNPLHELRKQYKKITRIAALYERSYNITQHYVATRKVQERFISDFEIVSKKLHDFNSLFMMSRFIIDFIFDNESVQDQTQIKKNLENILFLFKNKIFDLNEKLITLHGANGFMEEHEIASIYSELKKEIKKI